MNVTATGPKRRTSHSASSSHRTLSRRAAFRSLAIVACAALIGGDFIAAPKAAAQATAQFSYAESVVTGAASQPSGVAVDGSGNVYVADSASGWVLKQIPNNGTYASTVMAGGLSGPTGVAVDGSGNVYIADTGNNQVLKETPDGSSYTESPVVTGLKHPQGVAVDANGDVYIADTGDNVVLEESPSGGTYAQTGFWLIVGGQPDGIALDANGNIYVAISSQGEILKMTPGGPSSYSPDTVASGLNQPQDVAVDASGNVYVTDSGGELLKETPSGGSYTQSLVMSGLTQPQGVAAGPNGDLYVSDTNSRQVLLLQTGGVNFWTEAVGSPSTTGPTLTFTMNSSATLGAAQALTMGATGLAFNVTGSTCAMAVTINAGSTCTVTVAFTPKSVGEINGAVELTDIVGNVLATAYVYGAGTGPQIAFGPPAETMVGSGLNFANGVAVDGSGNLYVASSGAGQVVKETLRDGTYSQSVAVSGLTEPQHVAADGAGNLYVTDIANQLVVKETPNGSGGYTQTVVTNQLSSPDGVAVDGSGNVFVTDSTAGRLIEETPNGGSYTSNLVATGLGSPVDVAVDGSGNLYVADSAGNRVLKETPSNGAYTQSVVASGLNSPDGVAVDANGNVYISEGTEVLKETPNGGSYTQTVAANILGAPAGVVVDASGNLYISSPNLTSIAKEDVADAPTLSFRPTAVDVQSSDSPQTVTIENIGNQLLNFPIPLTGTNPQISQNFAYDSASTCTQTDPGSTAAFTLAPGTSCSLGIDFIPKSTGSLSGQAQLIDDDLNIPGPTYTAQSITLNGTGEQVVLSPAAGPLPAATVGTAYSQTLAVTGGASPYTFTATGVPAGLTLSAAGILSGTPTAAGSSSIAVTVSDANGVTATATYMLTVNQAVPVAPSDFSLTSGSAQSQTVSPGGKATFSFSVSPIGGSYPANVTFTATGLPTGATASFSPSSISANGGKQNVSLTIQTATAGTAMNHEPGSPFGGTALAFCFLLFPLLRSGRVRRQLLRRGAMLLLLIVASAAGMASLSGCGSQHAKAYTVTVAAASGSVTHSFTVDLKVK